MDYGRTLWRASIEISAEGEVQVDAVGELRVAQSNHIPMGWQFDTPEVATPRAKEDRSGEFADDLVSRLGAYDRSHVFLKIHTPLDKGSTQVSLIGKAAIDIVGPQPAPAELCPEPPANLKFKAALKLIAPILA